MTRDEVLNEVIDAIQALGLPGGSRAEVFRTIAALKSKPPEKSPEVEATKDTGTAFGEIYMALVVLKQHLARGRQAEEREAETIRRWRLTEDRYQEQIRTLEAEVARLKWEAAGAPQKGE